VYTRYREIKTWLKNTEAWQAVRAFGKSARHYLTEIKKTAALQHLKVASRRVVRHINSSLDLEPALRSSDQVAPISNRITLVIGPKIKGDSRRSLFRRMSVVEASSFT
jgi:hypothetical protein